MRISPTPWRVSPSPEAVELKDDDGITFAVFKNPDDAVEKPSLITNEHRRALTALGIVQVDRDELLAALTNLCKLMPKGDTLNYFYAKAEVKAARGVLERLGGV